MNIKIYKSYGVLAHEKQPFYSVSAPASNIYDEIKVEMPCNVCESASGEPYVTLGGVDYLVRESLTNWGDDPALVWYEADGKHHRLLKVVDCDTPGLGG